MKIVLAEREAELMQVLWEQGPSTVLEVQKHLKVRLAYTTVLTMLQKLEKKGYVRHQEEGRAHRYETTVRREAAQRSALRDLAGKLFNGSTALLLTHLVHDEALSDEDVRRIERLLQERKREGKS
ncbi:MAG TPA: BlaI/MecI/CopY family transcriptional regulator [Steroidobacteraceae bacterium]|nr:BlaI/MecI/CopY family transcriptional regulator [Steroidobacteraceae bacterium]